MIAVGIDPSLACSGVATIDTTTGQTLTRRVKTTNTGDTLLARRGRLRDVVAGVLTPLPARIDVTVIEVPNASQQFGAMAERQAITWWLIDQLFARGPVVAVTPPQRAKLATGNGRADKKAVLVAVRAQHPGVLVVDDNAADALALAAAGAHWLGHTQDYLPGQVDAFARITWPS